MPLSRNVRTYVFSERIGERATLRRPAGPLLLARHHGSHLRWVGPSHSSRSRSHPPLPRLRCQPHHVSPRSPLDHFSAAFGTLSQLIMAERDTHTDEALTRLVSTLPTNAAQLLVAQLDDELLWRNVLSGTEDATQDQPPPSLRPAASPLTMLMATTSTLLPASA